MIKKCSSISMIILMGLMVSLLSGQVATQEYARGKVFLSNGMTLEGKDLRMTMESVILDIGGQDQTFMLSEVVQVMAKSGKAKKFGQNCAGACVGLNLGTWLASGGTTTDLDGNEVDINPGQQLLSIALWGGISYGIGYLAGKMSDDWQVVYLNRG
ncbi:MAG: hypothetical protein HOB84_01955 [Candidatus Marinimicrobia bacterium]|jgi:hypothetical protein|nr:hypothetical protein [Candidatus Neomarinimicrobiota bacterium]MBT4361096.1 hypothetical protein [Candidatus Neomarinimicrobiota bacterium]MBT4713518.1 hypothetical protein [Candidatus Neomarinimicrobiota bacterium]MBT4946670.1 hypothetical protein [Candidatus Neomarinimicrobiota bacterium]MBT5268665.1 hypothetical protein [Candidatus Neomarinimicrobiota bacterium]